MYGHIYTTQLRGGVWQQQHLVVQSALRLTYGDVARLQATDRDLVCFNIQYRLGVFGFLALDGKYSFVILPPCACSYCVVGSFVILPCPCRATAGSLSLGVFESLALEDECFFAAQSV